MTYYRIIFPVIAMIVAAFSVGLSIGADRGPDLVDGDGGPCGIIIDDRDGWTILGNNIRGCPGCHAKEGLTLRDGRFSLLNYGMSNGFAFLDCGSCCRRFVVIVSADFSYTAIEVDERAEAWRAPQREGIGPWDRFEMDPIERRTGQCLTGNYFMGSAYP